MTDETTITIYTAETISTQINHPIEGDLILTLDQAITAWLAKNYKRSKSEKTRTAYKTTLEDFRSYLRVRGHDLDSDRKIVADCADQWADLSKQPGREISAATYKQRLAILSSFFAFAIKREVLDQRGQVIAYNPLDRLDRERSGEKQAARPIEPAMVKDALAAIDRSTSQGLRDYALLILAFTTGKRASELTGLRLEHLHFLGETSCVVRWIHCKGNKQMTSVLKAKVTKAIIEYLKQSYGIHYRSLPGDTPVWVSFSKRNRGQAIGYQTIRDMCDTYLGTTKVHTTRHSAVINMMRSGANVEEIRQFTGHQDIKELTTYLEELTAYENKYASNMEDAFCLD